MPAREEPERTRELHRRDAAAGPHDVFAYDLANVGDTIVRYTTVEPLRGA
jgi:hypothetical protein